MVRRVCYGVVAGAVLLRFIFSGILCWGWVPWGLRAYFNIRVGTFGAVLYKSTKAFKLGHLSIFRGGCY